MTILRFIALLALTSLTTHAAPQKVYEVVLKDVPGTGLVLELAFYTKPPSPQIVDKMLRQSLDQAVSIDGTRDILAMAFLGEDVLTVRSIRANWSTEHPRKR